MFTMLEDIKIIEVSNSLGGAACSKMLGDLGAEVLKVEPPGLGDPCRLEPPFLDGIVDLDRSGLFLAYNTNKKSITLNLEAKEGLELFLKLIPLVDVVVESYKVGHLDKLGAGYSALREINPRVILVSITPFGQMGPYKDFVSSDLVTQALGGHLITGGDSDREPMAFPDNQAAFITGRNSALATMAAVLHQRQTGEGQHVDISEVEAFAQVWHANRYTFTGEISGRGSGGGQGNVMDSMHLQAQDGYVTLTTAGTSGADSMDAWADFFEEPLLKDPKWKSARVRRESWHELKDLVEGKLKQMKKYDFFQKAMEKRLVVGVVQSPEDIVNCPHLEFRGSLVQLNHPVVGELKYSGPGFLANNENTAAAGKAAPRLGEDNQEIFVNTLGLTTDQLGSLHTSGVI